MKTDQLLTRTLGVALAVAWLCPNEAAAAIMASGDTTKPSTTTNYNGDEASGFTITEDVAWDPNAGPWIKRLVNCSTGCPGGDPLPPGGDPGGDPIPPGGGDPGGDPIPSDSPISSGQRVNITETLTNTGPKTWTDWHEEILTDTLINGNTQRGFLFDKNNTLTLMADYGAGFQALSEGVDYTVVGMDPTGPGSGANSGWEAIWIFFEPHAVIQTGDILKIEKQIFEVFGDANIWEPGEFVEVAQFPTIPEPSSLLLGALAGAAVFLQRKAKR